MRQRRMYLVVLLIALICCGCEDSKKTAEATTEPASQERTKAGVGVGKRGRSLDQFQDDAVQSVIASPAREFFRAKERIVFEIAIPQAMSLYKATNGEAPKSHEQFMSEIIEFNNIELPELPAGMRYQYDPETEQLMVEPEPKP